MGMLTIILAGAAIISATIGVVMLVANEINGGREPRVMKTFKACSTVTLILAVVIMALEWVG